MNAKDAILYLYDKGLLNIDAIMKNKDSIMQELDNTTEKLTKHNPCRLFKKGDIVEIDTHARDIAASMKKSGVELGKRYTVTEDENNTGYVSFIGEDGIEHHSMFFWLKLVTPAEETLPYWVEESEVWWNVYDSNEVSIASFFKAGHPNAKAAAEAECARLNAEYRKEQNND